MLCVAGFGVCRVFGGVAETRGQEPLIITGVAKVLSGEKLYTHPNAPPFDLMQYTPLYYHLAAYAAKAAGCRADDPERVTYVGRMLSVFFAAAQCVVAAFVCRRLLRTGVAMTVLAISAIAVFHAPWDFLARPDALVSCCFVLAVALALYGEGQSLPRRRNVAFACASVLGFIAFMAKQNGAQIVVILLAYLAMRRAWRLTALVAVLPSALLAAAAAAGPSWFGGYYFENAVGGLNNGIRPYAAFVTTYIPVFLHLNAAALTGVAAFAVMGWCRRGATRQEQFLATALVVSFALAGLSATKLGSAPNHYNDFLTVLAITLAHGLDSICRQAPENAPRVKWSVAAFAIVFFSSQAVAFRENFVDKPCRTFSAYDEIVDHMREELRAHPDDKLLTIDYVSANFFPGRVVLPQFSLSCIMYARGLVDFAAVQDMLDTGRVRWILAGPDQDIVRQLGFVGLAPRHFSRTANVGGFAIWTYDPDAKGPAQPR